MSPAKELTTAEVAAREKCGVKRIQALVRQERITGVRWHGKSLSFSPDYQITRPPKRPGRKRNAEK